MGNIQQLHIVRAKSHVDLKAQVNVWIDANNDVQVTDVTYMADLKQPEGHLAAIHYVIGAPPEFENLVVLDGTTNLFDDTPVYYNLSSPQLVYYNGNFYYAWRKEDFNTDMKKIAIKFKQDKTNQLVTDIGPARGDNYHSPCFAKVDNDGRMYIIYLPHGGYAQLYKGNAVEDVAAFTELSETIDTISGGEYGNVFRNPATGRYHYLARSGTSYLRFVSATLGLENWSYEKKLTEPVDMSPDANWFYQKSLVNDDFGGWNHICFQRRYTPNGGSTVWTDIWYLKTNDWITFWNIDESYSHNIYASNHITEAVLANYVVHNPAETGDFWAGFIDENTGYPYWIHLNRDITYWNGTAWVHFALPNNYNSGENIGTPVGANMVAPGKIRIYSRAGASPYDTRSHLITAPYTSLGIFEGTVVDSANGSFLAMFPHNYWQIRKGEKFPVLVGGSKDGVVSPTSNTRNNDVNVLWYEKKYEVPLPTVVIPPSRDAHRSMLFERANADYLISSARIQSLETSNGVDVEGPFTISAWINRNTFLGLQGIVELANNDGSKPIFKLEYRGSDQTWGSTFALTIFNGTSYSAGYTIKRLAVKANASGWVHLVAGYSGGQAGGNGMTLYQNVDNSGSNIVYTSGYNIMPAGDALTRLYIGRSRGGANYFDGYIDEISIWNKKLTKTEVGELYNNGLPLDPTQHSAAANLLDYRKLDSSLVDDSGNSNAILTNNGAAYDTLIP